MIGEPRNPREKIQLTRLMNTQRAVENLWRECPEPFLEILEIARTAEKDADKLTAYKLLLSQMAPRQPVEQSVDIKQQDFDYNVNREQKLMTLLDKAGLLTNFTPRFKENRDDA